MSGSLTTLGHPATIGALATVATWGSSLGARDLHTQGLRLYRGNCSSLLDEPIAASLPFTGRRHHLLKTLKARNLYTWADLTHLPPGGPRTWLPLDLLATLLTYAPEELPACPQDRTFSLRHGQLWILRSTAEHIGGLLEILSPAPAASHDIRLRRWLTASTHPAHITDHYATPGTTIQPSAQYLTVPAAYVTQHASHRCVAHLRRAGLHGTILATFLDSFAPHTTTPPSWADQVRPLLGDHKQWRVYTDGSWTERTTHTEDSIFQTDGRHEGRGAIVFVPDTAEWATDTQVVLRFHFPPRHSQLGGSAFLMELLACTAGLTLLDTLGLRGTVHTDCQGLVTSLLRPQPQHPRGIPSPSSLPPRTPPP